MKENKKKNPEPRVGDTVLVYVEYPTTRISPDYEGEVVATTDTQVKVERVDLWRSKTWHPKNAVEIITDL